MWLVRFNYLINEYLNCIFVISDTLVCRLMLFSKKMDSDLLDFLGYSTK